jgi:hypothetical protein
LALPILSGGASGHGEVAALREALAGHCSGEVRFDRLSRALYSAFRTLKQTFDPHGLLNPGKVVDAPPLTANLRFGPAYVTPEVPTTFDFSADGGLARSAELCAGVGECRKKRGGAMCPSYRPPRRSNTAPGAAPPTLRFRAGERDRRPM